MGVESSSAGGSGSCNGGGGSIDGIDTISRGVEAVKNNREISKKNSGKLKKIQVIQKLEELSGNLKSFAHCKLQKTDQKSLNEVPVQR